MTVVDALKRKHENDQARQAALTFVTQMQAAGLSQAAQVEASVLAFKTMLSTHVKPERLMSIHQKLSGEIREDLKKFVASRGAKK